MSRRTASSSPLLSPTFEFKTDNLPNSIERRSKQRNGMTQAGPGSTHVSPNRTMASLSIFYTQILMRFCLWLRFFFLGNSAPSSPEYFVREMNSKVIYVEFIQKSVACVSQRFYVPFFLLCPMFSILTLDMLMLHLG